VPEASTRTPFRDYGHHQNLWCGIGCPKRPGSLPFGDSPRAGRSPHSRRSCTRLRSGSLQKPSAATAKSVNTRGRLTQIFMRFSVEIQGPGEEQGREHCLPMAHGCQGSVLVQQMGDIFHCFCGDATCRKNCWVSGGAPDENRRWCRWFPIGGVRD
jgi:hypothetical protein